MIEPPAGPTAGPTAGPDVPPCAACLRRSWLIARLAGQIELAWLGRRPLPALLTLSDDALLAALAGRERARIVEEHARFDPARARARAADARTIPLCRCDPRYPACLHDLPDPPPVLYLHGSLGNFARCVSADRVAIVGARRATPYGLEQARSLGRGIAAAGLTVVSGMALGADAAAHAGALEVGGLTVAVLAGGPERAYPASKRALHQRIAASGAVVSELPPGTQARRWCFPARNRIIAALARATIVIEAGERSGSLITATLAADIGREIGAVPGLVTAPLAAGTNALIADGAQLVRGPRDVLELLFGAAALELCPPPTAVDHLEPDLQALLDRVGGGADTVAALVTDGAGVDAVLAGLAQLELRSRVRRVAGGRYVPTSAASR
jgi:DNA processing protein